jgi:hypothetical protein
MSLIPHSLSITPDGDPLISCPYGTDELCRPCLPYIPCGCRVPGDFEETRAHDGETCPVRQDRDHVVLRPRARPLLPGFPARAGKLGVLYVPISRCLLAVPSDQLAVYDASGALVSSLLELDAGDYEIEAWHERAGWLQVKLGVRVLTAA